jgi:hypothetical protein
MLITCVVSPALPVNHEIRGVSFQKHVSVTIGVTHNTSCLIYF